MDKDVLLKSEVLLEALPYIRQFYKKTIVIKYGGHAMKDEALKQAFAKCVTLLRYIGVNPVIVHGGGPQIGRMLDQLNIPSAFRDGLRITDDATMNVVEMVLAGQVNKQIVNQLNLAGGRAVGISGKDGETIRCRKLELAVDRENLAPEIIDLGHVGEVTGIDPTLIRGLMRDGFIPVIAPVGVDENGETYNINADTVASAVAVALEARSLVLLTDVCGILDKKKDRISSVDVKGIMTLIEDGTVSGGMIPKVQCCVEAVSGGVQKAQIIDGGVPNSLLLELFTEQGIGTEILLDLP
ncbi:acetylglutamate kinase [Desulfobaculum bizertense]|uniref:acetylglutamate kinase n=1 Tax=Desulfobaculum bizertense TaxID=376490 RepID=UPI001F3A8775|nr:acetylglutamate kinase [Desulfobaculum bizertense]UIJ38471.1 acetylglutamate kinase [Desulfobaculum bizertense]